MKNVLIAALSSVVLSGGAYAQSASDQDCEWVSLVAELIIKGHQIGLPFDETMVGIGKFYPGIVMVAYGTERLEKEEDQQILVKGYKHMIYVLCLDGYPGAQPAN